MNSNYTVTGYNRFDEDFRYIKVFNFHCSNEIFMSYRSELHSYDSEKEDFIIGLWRIKKK